MTQPFDERYAELYDVSVPDWPGEIDFYRPLAAEAQENGGAVLEVACGTGRVALRLARDGLRVTVLDAAPAMLAVAREKSAGLPHVRWVEGDMRAFNLGEAYGLVLIPGHSFQFMLTPGDHVACLACIEGHLEPGGRLVVHLDHQEIDWLGDLVGGKGGVFEPPQEVTHPGTGRRVRTRRAWTCEPATQTAAVVTVTEELGDAGQVLNRWQRGPVPQHCVFRFEMEHLLARVGFEIEGVCGDFFQGPLADDSSEMVWLARRPQEIISALNPTGAILAPRQNPGTTHAQAR